ncbi:hypothetical protein P0Y35_14470 [Kiritimatiellaeota bacterium B1221]|nr:hypothetical protein [Kiritimatiellaeota bacterium B1221]
MTDDILCGICLMVFAVFHALFRYLCSREKFDLGDIAIWMTCVYVGLGPLLSRLAGYNEVYESNTIYGSVLICALLYIFGIMISQNYSRKYITKCNNISRGNFYTKFGLQQFVLFLPKIKFIYIILGYLVVWLYRIAEIKGGGGFSGTEGLSVTLSIPYWLVVLHFVFRAMPFVLIFYMLYMIHIKRASLLIFSLLIFETVYTFTNGRRDMLNVLIIYAVALLLFNQRLKLRYVFAFCVILILLLKLIFPYFYQFRLSIQENKSSYNGIDISQALDDVKLRSEDKEYNSYKFRENIQRRARMNYMWIEVVQGVVNNSKPLYGEVQFSAIMSTIPRHLRPSKYWQDNALIIQKAYGLRAMDASDNFIAVGYADFKYIGVLINGIWLGCILTFVPIILVKCFNEYPFVVVLVFCHIFPLALDFEISPTTIYATVRSVLVILTVSYILKYLVPRSKVAHF